MENPLPLNSTLVLYCTVSVLGRDKGYTVKYSPLPDGVPKVKGKWLYLTVYPELSPNADGI